MYLRTLLILFVIAGLIIFAAINWGAFVTPTTLSLIFLTVDAPLGLILLAIVAVLSVFFLVYVVYLQSSVLMESRRHGRELQAQRELAAHAEASRVSELRAFLQDELGELMDRTEASRAGVLARLDQLERELRVVVEQSGNTLAAYIGEVEDRLERAQRG